MLILTIFYLVFVFFQWKPLAINLIRVPFNADFIVTHGRSAGRLIEADHSGLRITSGA